MAYLDALLGSLERGLRDRAGLLVRALFLTTLLMVFDRLWAVASHDATSALARYGHRGMLWYVLATEVAVIVVPARHIEAVSAAISSGAYEAELVRPARAWLLRVSDELGAALVHAVGLLAWGAALVWWLVGPPPDWATVLCALPATLLAVVCGVIGLHTAAALAFWVRDTHVAWFLFQKLVFVVGGMLMPLAFLPHGVQVVAWLSPFPAMAYVPGQLSSGHWEPGLLGVQLGWIIVLAAAAHLAFARGEQRMVRG